MAIIIRTTDLAKRSLVKKEFFNQKEITVISRSGLHPLEYQLITQLTTTGFGSKVAFIENRTGTAPLLYYYLHPQAEVTAFNFDSHHSAVIRRTVLENHPENKEDLFTVLTAAYLSEGAFYDTIFLQAPRDMETELLQSLIQDCYGHLHKGGRLMVLHQGRDEFIYNQLENVFSGCTILMSGKKVGILIAKKKEIPFKLKSFQAEFEVFRAGKEMLKLISIPGVFSHRRVDGGAQAMIDTVTLLPGQKLLDMGCGCGSIGIAVSVDVPETEVHFVDSSARAIAATIENCQKVGLKNYTTYLTDQGIEKPEYFDVVTGNPPYFSDYRIAEMFLDTAWKSLKKDGIVYVVAKSIAWHEEYLKEKFGNCEVISRRGYKIAKAIKTPR